MWHNPILAKTGKMIEGRLPLLKIRMAVLKIIAFEVLRAG